MSRVKTSYIRRKRHSNLLKKTKGYIGRRNNCFRIAKQAYIKSCIYSRRDRKKNHSVIKSNCIRFVNFFLRSNYNISYNSFISLIKTNNCLINVFIFNKLISFSSCIGFFNYLVLLNK